MFFRTPAILSYLFPKLEWRANSDKKEIFLTFDDGPIPGPTEFVLFTLKEYEAKATFFCIGDNVRKHPQVFEKIISAKHSVGNHTFNHLKGWNYSTKDYLTNVEKCAEQILQVNSQQSTVNRCLFRPPYGRITFEQIKSLKKDYKIIMWDVLTQDYSQSMAKEKCLEGSIKATRPGSIVVFHDSLKAERNLNYALPKYLDHFSKEGYIFSAL
jgi:peptidoglycan/xylan/chitin deacetylase (PgdA/CDA1 family)